MTTYRKPGPADIGKIVEVQIPNHEPGELIEITHSADGSICYVEGVGAWIDLELARIAADPTELSIAADLCADWGYTLAEGVLRNWPQVIEAIGRIVVDEGVDAGVILLDGESRTQWNNERQRSEYLNDYFSELGEALVLLSRMIKGAANANR